MSQLEYEARREKLWAIAYEGLSSPLSAEDVSKARQRFADMADAEFGPGLHSVRLWTLPQ